MVGPRFTFLAVVLVASAAGADVTVSNGRLVLSGPITFESNSDRLRPDSDAVLLQVRDYLQAKPDITMLRIEGHVDADAQNGQALSDKRAMSTARWLVGKGIACARLLPVGFGNTKPIAPNDTPDNKAKNRRIELAPAALRGRAIGGMPVDGGGHVAADPCTP